jgi:hypothetical protein
MRYGLAAIVIVTTGTAYALAHLSYVSRAPLEISRNFLDLIQAGDLAGAYLLTNQGAMVGSTVAAFEGNVRHQARINVFPTNRSVKLIGIHGFQSYGNRLRRWIMGRKIDPDQVSVDYFFGPHPFEVRLRSNDRGGWLITFFQSHAM